MIAGIAVRRTLPPHCSPGRAGVSGPAGRAQAGQATDRGGPAMTEPERMHSTESAEGDEPGDEETGGRTPHSEQPAEGEDTGNGQGPAS
jgi:hypothetical protein